MLTTYFVISKVYNDAEELEKLLLAKHAELGPPPEAEEAASVHESATSPSKSSVRSLTLAVKTSTYLFVGLMVKIKSSGFMKQYTTKQVCQ